MNKSEVKRLRTDNFYDMCGIVKSLIWDNPVEIDNGIYLGNIGHGFFYSTLDNFNIKGVVNVTGDIPNYYNDIEYFNIRIPDLNSASIIGDLEGCYDFINRTLESGNVLIHCVFGRSRSVAVCVFYLMKKYGLSFEEAYSKIESQKNIINLNVKFAEEIKNYFANSAEQSKDDVTVSSHQSVTLKGSDKYLTPPV